MKKKSKSLIAILLVACLALTSIAAYMTSFENKEEVYTVGNVEAAIIGDLDLSNVEGGLMPGVSYPYARAAQNTGENDAFVFMTITLPYENTNLIKEGSKVTGNVELLNMKDSVSSGAYSNEWKLVDLGKIGKQDITSTASILNPSATNGVIGNGTITYAFGYVGENGDNTLKPLLKEQTTVNLFDSFELANITGVSELEGDITTRLYAIQTTNVNGGLTDVNGVWAVINSTLNNRGGSTPTDPTEPDETDPTDPTVSTDPTEAPEENVDLFSVTNSYNVDYLTMTFSNEGTSLTETEAGTQVTITSALDENVSYEESLGKALYVDGYQTVTGYKLLDADTRAELETVSVNEVTTFSSEPVVSATFTMPEQNVVVETMLETTTDEKPVYASFFSLGHRLAGAVGRVSVSSDGQQSWRTNSHNGTSNTIIFGSLNNTESENSTTTQCVVSTIKAGSTVYITVEETSLDAKENLENFGVVYQILDAETLEVIETLDGGHTGSASFIMPERNILVFGEWNEFGLEYRPLDVYNIFGDLVYAANINISSTTPFKDVKGQLTNSFDVEPDSYSYSLNIGVKPGTELIITYNGLYADFFEYKTATDKNFVKERYFEECKQTYQEEYQRQYEQLYEQYYMMFYDTYVEEYISMGETDENAAIKATERIENMAKEEAEILARDMAYKELDDWNNKNPANYKQLEVTPNQATTHQYFDNVLSNQPFNVKVPTTFVMPAISADICKVA